VGKTSLLERMVTGECDEKPKMMIGVNFKHQEIEQVGSRFKILYYDVGGNDHITKYYPFIQEMSLLLFVFKVDSSSSLDFIQKVLDKVPLNNSPKILVGNKIDLVNQREISTETAEKFAVKHNMKYIETSAKDGLNINKLNTLILDLLI